MGAENPALDKFNERNREFWSHQKTLMDRRMADRAVLETAVESVRSENKRQVAIQVKNPLKRPSKTPKERSRGLFASKRDRVERPQRLILCKGLSLMLFGKTQKSPSRSCC